MVVDDEPSLRETVRIILESEGYTIIEADSADECWKLIRKNIPDLILLDIKMPGMPPIELIRRIKENPELRKIKIVYMTGIAGTKQFTKRIEGIIDTIEKPFKNEDLVNMVKEALSYEVI